MSSVFGKFVSAAGASLLVLAAMNAAAHHSAAQFDFRQRVTVEGVIKEFNVKNPHTMAIVELSDEERGTRDVEFEGHSASHFYRAGYERGMAKPGDRIAILIAPRGDGEDGGFIQAFTVNGRTIGFGGLSPETGEPTSGAGSGE